jgi:phosphoglycolate phosphatase-like HAD superfamily hydrolase
MADDTGSVLLLWDVDHTLIDNGGVGYEIYALAFEILTGRAPSAQPRTDGRTELDIMANILAANGEDPSAFSLDQQWDAAVEATSRSSAALAEQGHALAGAETCLKRVSVEPGIRQSVLTGNIRPNAVVKLRAFGLDHWMNWDIGGYGWDSRERPGLVPAAQERARRHYGFDAARDVTVLVGDTPLDVQAGITGGARVIAVATGNYPGPELASAGADVVRSDLADVDAFMAALTTFAGLGPVAARRGQ